MPKATPKIIKQEVENAKGENLSFNMVEVEGGSFMMGLNGQYEDEKPAHEVRIDSFWAAEYLVTQELYEFVVGENPSNFLGKQRPVEQVDWYNAVEFCNALSKLAGLEPYYKIDKIQKDPNNENEEDEKRWLVEINDSSKGYRLPTEAEWEYSARGGHSWQEGYEYAGSNNLKEVGWYNENSHAETLPVGTKQSNQLGLYDMSGNVWEWCYDWYDGEYYKNSEDKNPLGAKKGDDRVVRGGSWFSNNRCRVADRIRYDPDNWSGVRGFRVFQG
ncbi:MAG: sulfatase-modifying factor protein [Thalassobius sp.]|nr:sulfatase-modifying factor protein [Thalassovita sp.]